jgi:hypothetical protein
MSVTDETISQHVLDLIKKLLTLSENEGATEAEAANAAGKAQKLLDRYNLERADVEQRTGEKSPYVMEHGALGGSDHSREWRIDLIRIVASYNYCQAITYKNRKIFQYTIIGKKENIEVCIYLYSFLARQVQKLTGQAWYRQSKLRAAGMAPNTCSKMVWERSYARGVIYAINAKLKAQRDAASPQTMALVIVTGVELAEATNSFFPDLQTTDKLSGRRAEDEATWAGYTDGKEHVQLTRGVKGGTDPRVALPSAT